MDYPYNEENRVFVPLNLQYTINISPMMVLMDEAVKRYPLNARKCFIEEKEWNHMKTFKVKKDFK